MRDRWRTDEAGLTSAAEDFGHCVHAKPAAVLAPRSPAEVQEAVSYAAGQGRPLAARGAGHSTYGQGQAADGIVLDMTELDTVHEVGPDHIVVDAGARWSDVVAATLPGLRTPPVLTDFLGTTVGGTLSVGGFGGASHRHGAQTDNVVDLDVVTGTGALVRCSPLGNRDLFDCVRGGLGQFGVIVRATLRLVPAFDKTHWYKFLYNDLTVFLAEQTRLAHEGMFDHVEGRVLPLGSGPWRYRLDLAKHCLTGDPPDERSVLRSLHPECRAEPVEVLPHAEFLDRMAAGEQELRRTGEWFHPHPWLNMLLPAPTAEGFVRQALDGLTQESTGRSGLVIVYPLPTAKLATPFVRKPTDATAFMVALLRTALPGEQGPMIASNRQIYEQALAAGGVAYPVNALPMSPEDWRRHFGPLWNDFARAKRRFDPNIILTPGHGIRLI
ncbi:FAD-binding protein [Streptomyces sp. WI04-05B]|uniref:Cytokinin oxidase n=2 Tax=Streptomyces turgidiscabies TaxID=85558 RepID=L7F3A1_STRT8|nr:MULTISPECIES: FAD-binding protein [Streptomyces]ELP66073.1 cytokinin oxidase [Streptomyces turgidiscabies Car8]MDX2548205.1 FAD-binding protein [Streptomyces sp. WI04-05B]MDX2590242.1 FAD-binding protein [Streptomyces sp. WI04-05A]MDX3499994.1 FAD-binding protein [Streptomyces turgidiscabies]GAQ77387.1 putative oxidoreductase ORF5 in fasciation locus [Streptomyces turgidiscabies]